MTQISNLKPRIVLSFMGRLGFMFGVSLTLGVLIFSYDRPRLWVVLLFGISPLLLLLDRAGSIRRAFWWGWLGGSVFLAGVLRWFWAAWPLDWMGIDDRFLGGLLVGIGWLISAALLGLGIGGWAAAFFWLKRGRGSDVALAASLWVIFEFGRAFIFSIFWFGSAGLIGDHWGFGFLGYALASSSHLRPLAGFGGVYALSFVVVACNMLIVWGWQNYRPSWRGRSIGIVAVSFLIILGGLPWILKMNAQPIGELEIVAVHTDFGASFQISAREAEARFALTSQLLARAAQTKAELIVLPEDARFMDRADRLGRAGYVTELLGRRNSLLVDSARTSAPDSQFPVSTFFFHRLADGFVQTSHKQLLVPHGEYLPSLTTLLATLVGQGRWIEAYELNRGYDRGSDLRVAEFEGVRIGALFCSEILSADLQRQLVGQGAQVLLNSASHSAFRGSKAVEVQTLQMAQVRAAEVHRFIVLAGNVVPAYVLDQTGELVARTGRPAEILEYSVALFDAQTIWQRFGLGLLAIPFFLIVILGGLKYGWFGRRRS